jgi:hypothetical protein
MAVLVVAVWKDEGVQRPELTESQHKPALNVIFFSDNYDMSKF